ncbi:MAG: chemotaxis protein CheA [Bryobacteraceae bacterium]|nr:chemotaxis protein CheA [Bryobacteraceae bacterium]
MEFDISRFRDTFFQEAEEHAATMEAELLRLEQGGGDAESLNAIFRCAHSIKGASGTFGFDDIAKFTHALETLLEGMRAGRIEPTAARAALLLRSVDVLRELLAAARTGGPPPAGVEESAAQLVVAQRADWAPNAPAVARVDDSAARPYRIRFVPAPEIFLQGMDPVLVLRELERAGEVQELRVDLSRLPPLAQLDPEICYLGWDLRLRSEKSAEDLRDVFAFVEDGARVEVEPETARPALSAPSVRAPVRDSTSIRVTTEKVDKLVDLVGELVIAQSMAAEILNNFTASSLLRLQEAFSEMERYTRELQERVMGVRMLPIGSVFSRFPRLVHDLAEATGKRIVLEMSGEETELDKAVVESLGDPLTHLIRNAVDHGLEPPEERRAAGKPEQGAIRLHAFHQGGNVIVEASDDGRGLDAAKIRRKAVERGLLAEDQPASEEQIHAMLFEPGFSTAEQVSSISGRGVGMDVVKRTVEGMNGAVSISSAPGRGTSVRIKLPLTLAILDGLLLRVGEQTYILPLVAILESVRPTAAQLNSMAGQGEVVIMRGEPLPLVRLHRLLNVPTEVTDATRGLLVLVENHGRRLALLVDELLGQQQVVIKSLESNFRKVEGVVGATILGDGRAALILDVAGLAQMARNARGVIDR